jgi:hypothetical protein
MEQQGYTKMLITNKMPTVTSGVSEIHPTLEAVIASKHIIAKHELDSCTLALWASHTDWFSSAIEPSNGLKAFNGFENAVSLNGLRSKGADCGGVHNDFQIGRTLHSLTEYAGPRLLPHLYSNQK